MGFFGSSKNKSTSPWDDLTSISQLGDLEKESENIPVLIFKHSTRCNISAMAKDRLLRQWDTAAPVKAYYLDLLNHRDVSNEIETRYHVTHQSPQIILLKNGASILNASHSDIDFNTIKRFL